MVGICQVEGNKLFIRRDVSSEGKRTWNGLSGADSVPKLLYSKEDVP